MVKKRLSVSSALGYGFRTFFHHLPLFFLCLLTFLGLFFLYGGFIIRFALSRETIYSVSLLANSLRGGLRHFDFSIISFTPRSFVEIVLILLAMTPLLLVRFGLERVALQVYDHDKSSVRTLFGGLHQLPRLVGSSIIYLALIAIGLCFFVIPGIYILLRFSFVNLLIIDKDMGVFEAFKRSAMLTRGNMWRLFWLEVVDLTLSKLVIFWFVPLMADVYFYRQLSPAQD